MWCLSLEQKRKILDIVRSSKQQTNIGQWNSVQKIKPLRIRSDLSILVQLLSHKQLGGIKISDKINSRKIFKDQNLLSINQINAQIKLTEVWKSKHVPNYPLTWISKSNLNSERLTRSNESECLIINGNSKQMTSTFMSDAANLWNKAPVSIKNCDTKYKLKKEILSFVKTLPF